MPRQRQLIQNRNGKHVLRRLNMSPLPAITKIFHLWAAIHAKRLVRPRNVRILIDVMSIIHGTIVCRAHQVTPMHGTSDVIQMLQDFQRTRISYHLVEVSNIVFLESGWYLEMGVECFYLVGGRGSDSFRNSVNSSATRGRGRGSELFQKSYFEK